MIVIRSHVFQDDRGYFRETFRSSEFEKNGIRERFVQDNLSFSKKGTIRGLHFQRKPNGQGKLVSVAMGRVFDVAVDIRRNSNTFGRYFSIVLDHQDGVSVYIPEGFAHGFLALEDSVVLYKTTAEYAKESEGGILWNDPSIGIAWPFEPVFISEKDRGWPTLRDQGGVE